MYITPTCLVHPLANMILSVLPCCALLCSALCPVLLSARLLTPHSCPVLLVNSLLLTGLRDGRSCCAAAAALPPVRAGVLPVLVAPPGRQVGTSTAQGLLGG